MFLNATMFKNYIFFFSIRASWNMLKIEKNVKLTKKLKLIETKQSLTKQQKQLLTKYSCFSQYK